MTELDGRRWRRDKCAMIGRVNVNKQSHLDAQNVGFNYKSNVSKSSIYF